MRWLQVFNLRSLIGRIRLFYFPRWIGCIFLGVTNTCSNPGCLDLFLAFKRERLPRQKNVSSWRSIRAWIFSLVSFKIRSWISNTLERCHNLRAITSHRLMNFPYLTAFIMSDIINIRIIRITINHKLLANKLIVIIKIGSSRR